MIAIVLLALALLALPSCQWGLVSPEPQSVPFPAEDPEFDVSLAAERSTPQSPAPKTARQYVREAYQLLLVGKAGEARRALQAALQQAPQNQQAAMLLRQIEDDPAARFGAESFAYRVQANDTLTGLAHRFLGDPLQFYALAKYNDIANPSRIAAGQLIRIPGKLPEPKSPPSPEPDTAPASPTVPEPPPPEAPSSPVAAPPPLAQPETATPSEAASEPVPTPAGRDYAVMIGIEAYAHLDPLGTAVTDAMAVTQVLEARYGFNAIFLPDATRVDILQVLANLGAILIPQDRLLIYYAGHGLLDEDARCYWLLQDARPAVRSGWLATAEITEAIKTIAAQQVMVIADSCYAGTQERMQADDRPAAGWQANLRSRTVMTSGTLKPVADRDGGRLSVFAKALVTALYTNRETLEGQQLLAKMRPWLAVHASQTPVYANLRHAEHEGGDFLLVSRSPRGR